MGAWGDINAALNRLVAEGTITAFRTNHADGTDRLMLHIIVATPVADRGDPAYCPAGMERIREAVAGAMGPYASDATITVTSQLPAR